MKDKLARDYGTGSIYQRKDGRWVTKVRVGIFASGVESVKYFYSKTEREAKKKLKDYSTELAKYDISNVRKMTVESYMMDWLRNTKANELKPKSYDRLEQTIVNQITPSIGLIQAASLSSDDVQKLINKLKNNGKSYSTIKKVYDAINECYRTGTIKKTVISNPALGVTLPKKRNTAGGAIKFYSEDEAKKICQAAVSRYNNGKRIYRLGDVVILAINTGLRAAELRGLRWEDVDFENRVLNVTTTRVYVLNRSENASKKYITIEQEGTKSEAGIRSIYLNDAAYEAIQNLMELTGSGKYVLETKDGKPVEPSVLDKMCRSIVKASGISHVYGMHAFRHTFATMLFAAGVNVKTVSEILGHSDVNITYNIYIHTIEKQKKKAVESIPKIV